MKKIKFVLFLIFLSSSLFAQSPVDFQVSKPYRVVDAPFKQYFHVGDDMFSVKAGRGKITLQLFDTKSMKEVTRNEFEMERGQTIENAMELGGKLYLFYSIYDKENEKEELFYKAIDIKSCTLSNSATKLISTKRKIRQITYATEKDGEGVKFNFSTSYDKSKLLVQYRLKPESRSDSKNHDEIGLYVFDSSLKTLSGDDYKMPYTEKEMDNLDYSIDSKGNIFLLISVKNDKDDKNKTITMLGIPVGQKQFVSTGLDLEKTEKTKEEKKNQKVATSANLYETAAGEMLVGGLYRVGKNSGVDGMFLLKVVDMKNSLSFYEIPVDILNQFESKRTQKKNNKDEAKGKADVDGFVLRNVIVNPDGSTLINAEKYYVIVYVSQDNFTNTTSTRYEYHYDFIIATKINKDGSVAWMRKIPKEQISGGGSSIGFGFGFGFPDAPVSFARRGGLSFRNLKVGDNQYYLFLDNKKNEKLKIDEAPRKHVDGAGGFFTTYVINDKTGEMNRSTIFDTRDLKGTEVFQFNVNRVFPLSSDEIGVEVYKKKKEDVFVKIKLK